MPRFKILEGIHQGGNGAGKDGVTYTKGDVIQTDVELDVLFANKYKRLTGRTRSSRDHDDLPDHGGGTKVMDSKRRLEKRVAKESKAGPGPGQTQEEFDQEMEKENFIDLSKEAGTAKMKAKAGKDVQRSANKKVLTKRSLSADHDEDVEEAEVTDEEQTYEDDEEFDTEEEEESEEEDEVNEEDEDKPPKKAAKEGKKPTEKPKVESSDEDEESGSEDEEEEPPPPKKKVKAESEKPKMGMKKKKH